ncbi:hypothetical protein C8F01DRAFT_1231297, partial [Mycena amicta]
MSGPSRRRFSVQLGVWDVGIRTTSFCLSLSLSMPSGSNLNSTENIQCASSVFSLGDPIGTCALSPPYTVGALSKSTWLRCFVRIGVGIF